MKLNNIERNEPIWLKLKAELETRLSTLRTRLETDLDPVETQKTRGRIAEIKLILDSENPDPVIQ